MVGYRLLISIFILGIFSYGVGQVPSSERSKNAIENNQERLKREFQERKFIWGNPVFIRIFKESGKLELWIENSDNGKYELFKTYDICYFSGELGPKTRQGDNQSPEGFYFVTPARLNPWSSYHLSFNLGYPNAYDRAHGYTGNYLMVHGNCVSIGCYAMTDPVIEEIWTIIHASLSFGQPFFRVHIFPFKLTTDKLERNQIHPWYSFWKNLKTGYDWFEEKKKPPNVEVRGGRYVFD